MAPQAPAPDSDATRSPFSIPIFRAIWTASLASNFGAAIQSVAASWTMTSLGAPAQLIALVQGAMLFPLVLLSLLAGAIADSFDRRRVMLCAQVAMLGMSLALSVCGTLGLITPWLLLGFTFAIGCGVAINGPAWQASVGDMVPRSALAGAVAINSMGFNLARSAGPAIGGLIVATAGASVAFAVNSMTYLGLIAVLLRWRRPATVQQLPREGLGQAMSAGIVYVAMSPELRLVLTRAILFGVPASALPALMPLVARDLAGGGSVVFGMLSAAFGVGAVTGAVGRFRLRSKIGPNRIVSASTLALIAGLVLVCQRPGIVVTLLSVAMAGCGWVSALSTFSVSMQLGAPRWVAARALSVYQMGAFGGMAVGSWAVGLIAGHHGVATALLSAAGVQSFGLLLGLRRSLPDFQNVDLTPSDLWTEPTTAAPVEPNAGPVTIIIEHRVAEASIGEFFLVMDERRRIRRRDGARGWSLVRDLEEPTIWMERYSLPTWAGYVRHNHRRTQVDLANALLIRSMQIDDRPQVIHRLLDASAWRRSGRRSAGILTTGEMGNDFG